MWEKGDDGSDGAVVVPVPVVALVVPPVLVPAPGLAPAGRAVTAVVAVLVAVAMGVAHDVAEAMHVVSTTLGAPTSSSNGCIRSDCSIISHARSMSSSSPCTPRATGCRG